MTGRRRENGRRPERLLQALAETREKNVDALRQIFPPEYVDVPPETHAAARKSLHAHVQRIRQLDLLREDGASAWRQAA